MSLTAKDVAEITRLLEDSSFDELYLELDGLKLTLRRGAAAADPSPEKLPASAAAPAAAAALRTGAAADERSAATPAPEAPAQRRHHSPAADPDATDLPSPLLGTFYRAPKPGAPPFVDVGTPVEEETIIGIIEVMKLMNTVRAGIRGRVSEILARDGQLVEFGETLLRIQRTD